jgi:hypothetical protein
VSDDDLAVFERIAAAVAEGHEPDLSSADLAEVRAAMQRVLSLPVSRQNFLAWLSRRVETLSAGKVTTEERQTEDAGDVPELAVRRIVVGESFAEPVVIRADAPVVRFPMRR